MPIARNCKNLFRHYDEYYTRYEHVKDIFDRYIPQDELKDKVIYCPCDSDKSNFVVYLKEHKEDLGYKELVYTWDDYNTHMDLFERCDIIITNPPFSKLLREFIPILNKVNKKFFILGSMISTQRYVEKFLKYGTCNIKYIYPDKFFDFIIPEYCEYKNNIGYIYISNMNIPNYHKELKFDKQQNNNIFGYIDNCKYKAYDKLNTVPLDCLEPIIVPSTVQFEHNKKFFDILLNTNEIKNMFFSDGKNRYFRVLVKRKQPKN